MTTVHKTGEVDIFLKVTGVKHGFIKGESQDASHKDEIEVEAFSWQVDQPRTDHGAGLASGKRIHGPFRILMRTNAATPILFQACVTGEVLKDVTLTCRKAGKGPQAYLKWVLSNAFITQFKTGYRTEDQLVPTDELSLASNKITVEYRAQKSDGTLGGAVTGTDDMGSTR
jgi:type VI secretion system secreted protein Hcp